MNLTKQIQINLNLLAVLLTVALLAACGGTQSPEAAETEREKPAPIEVTDQQVEETASEEAAEPEEVVAEELEADDTVAASATPAIDLPNFGPAPEIENDIWLNSDPLRLAELKGKVVLLEFWTFGCINCQRVTPYVREWHDKYAGDEFVVLTVHYPEFGYEEDVDNVREALEKNGIEYAVAIDNDGLTWRAYNQRYWPTRYLIDKEGNIRYKHIGEGGYEATDAAIQQLIAEPLSQ